jgi:hypothetical protein
MRLTSSDFSLLLGALGRLMALRVLLIFRTAASRMCCRHNTGITTRALSLVRVLISNLEEMLLIGLMIGTTLIIRVLEVILVLSMKDTLKGVKTSIRATMVTTGSISPTIIVIWVQEEGTEVVVITQGMLEVDLPGL